MRRTRKTAAFPSMDAPSKPIGYGWSIHRGERWKEPAARRRRSDRPSLALFRLCVALPKGGFSSIGHLNPFRVRRGLGVVFVVPVPPLVRRGLGVTLWRVLPGLLTAERCDV